MNQLLFARLGIAEQLLTAANGQEALAVLQQRCADQDAPCPALILLDLHMPVMDGWAVLEHYGRLPAAVRSATSVVVLTSSQHPRDLARVQQYPVKGMLAKPLTEATVLAVLREHAVIF